ncbi:hypothetical protein BC567DRAFT_233344 [Phyllosticta citribraziliensis]
MFAARLKVSSAGGAVWLSAFFGACPSPRGWAGVGLSGAGSGGAAERGVEADTEAGDSGSCLSVDGGSAGADIKP